MDSLSPVAAVRFRKILCLHNLQSLCILGSLCLPRTVKLVYSWVVKFLVGVRPRQF